MPDEKVKDDHVSTRAKREQRGFYREKQPGFYGVKRVFDKAEERANGAKTAGYLAALAKFGLFLDHPQPVEALTEHFQSQSDGLTVLKNRRAPGTRIFRSDGPALGQQSVADRVSPGWQNRGGIEYGGV